MHETYLSLLFLLVKFWEELTAEMKAGIQTRIQITASCSLTLIFKASEIGKHGQLGNFVCQKQMTRVKHSYWLAALMGDPVAALLCSFASRHCLPIAGACKVSCFAW